MLPCSSFLGSQNSLVESVSLKKQGFALVLTTVSDTNQKHISLSFKL